jgi:hypothetical protein
MYQNSNNIIFLFENSEQYSLSYVKKGLGELYGIFLENNYLSLSNDAVRFSYTGIAANRSNLFCILPKYLKGWLNSDIEYINQAKQLIKALKVYQNNIDLDIPDAELINYSSHSINSEIALADFILNDYLQNGLCSFVQKNIVNNSENEILWDYTIENTYPVVSKSPYYFDTYSNENLLLTNNIISKIHNWAINYCKNKYSDLLDIYIDIVDEQLLFLEDIGEKSFLLNAIEKELRITFNDRNISLLKALSELINASGQYGENTYTLYGKNKFEHVWEAAVSFCFKNQYHTFKKHLSPPIWANNSGSIVSEKHTVKPDVIRWIVDGNKSTMLIVDAKYYLFRFDDINKKAENNPGVGDIIKQYFYEFILSRDTSSADWLKFSTEYINMLVFPGMNIENTMEIIGSVSIESSIKTKPIINVYINPNILFNNYIIHNPFSDREIFEIANSATKN